MGVCTEWPRLPTFYSPHPYPFPACSSAGTEDPQTGSIAAGERHASLVRSEGEKPKFAYYNVVFFFNLQLQRFLKVAFLNLCLMNEQKHDDPGEHGTTAFPAHSKT